MLRCVCRCTAGHLDVLICVSICHTHAFIHAHTFHFLCVSVPFSERLPEEGLDLFVSELSVSIYWVEMSVSLCLPTTLSLISSMLISDTAERAFKEMV